MTDSLQNFDEIDALLAAALEEPHDERSTFLEHACEQHPALAEQLRRLVQAGDERTLDLGLDAAWSAAMASEGSAKTVESVGAVFGERYRIDAPLGQGGMAEVFRATDLKLKRHVALKVVREDDRWSGHFDRLEREALTASGLNHPNLVTVHDVGREEDCAWIAMELVDGESLADLLERRRLTPGEALAIAAQVADGLSAAHENGVVHRDLKPGNVMLTRDGRAKIVDFGLARTNFSVDPEADTASLKATLTAAGAIVGTVSYMSPEQAIGRDLDFRSDQFSFGVMLFEMLTGRRPFPGDSAVEVLAAIIHHDPPSVLEEAPALPHGAAELLDRCLAKQPDERWISSRDLLRAIEELQAGESAGSSASVSARTSTVTRGASRGRLGLAAAVATLLTLFLVWVVARRASDTTSERLTDAQSLQGSSAGADRAALPAVAVLPFDPLGGGEENQYFAVGIAEDLMERLSTWNSFDVISDYSDGNVGADSDLGARGRSLGARYVVTGSVRRADDRVRIAARVLDAESGVVVWNDRYDRDWEDLLDLQEEIAEAVVTAMHPNLERFDRMRALQLPPDDMAAWDWAQQGWWHWDRMGIDDLKQARTSFEKAIELDDGFATAHAGLALVEYIDIVSGYVEDPDPHIESLLATADRAVTLDPRNPHAQHAIGHAYALQGERDRMLAAYRRARELSPYSTLILTCSGEGMAMAGEHEEALGILTEAIKLGPNDPLIPYAYHAMSLGHFAAGRYEETLQWTEKALLEYPEFSWVYRTEASTLAHLGRLEEAGKALERAIGHNPHFDLTGGLHVMFSAEKEVAERYIAGMAKAGEPPGL